MPEAVALATVREALLRAADRLGAAGVDSPRLDAELLLASVLGVGRDQLVTRSSERLDSQALSRFEELIARRTAREPVAYILGRRSFRHIELGVDARVLIPRPETELLVEVGLTLPQGAAVADIGTGSGAVALALKHERPDLEVWGTDVDSTALELARENAGRLGLDVNFVCGDLLEAVARTPDAVLANLPYVAAASDLAAEIVRYEPAGALFAGPDGLDVIRRLAAQLAGVPLVALEVGLGQASAVVEMLSHAGYRRTDRLRDLAGIERVVVGRR